MLCNELQNRSTNVKLRISSAVLFDSLKNIAFNTCSVQYLILLCVGYVEGWVPITNHCEFYLLVELLVK